VASVIVSIRTMSRRRQPSELVEFTVTGQFVGQFSVDPGIGAAFGLAVAVSGDRVRFAAVDDATNVLDIWDLD
jgi:hypothetical protein